MPKYKLCEKHGGKVETITIKKKEYCIYCIEEFLETMEKLPIKPIKHFTTRTHIKG